MSKNIEPPEPDPDRHLKRIGKIFGVSMRIQKLALQRKKSPAKVSTDEELKHSLLKGKNARSDRSSSITGKESFVLDMAAHLLNLDLDIILEGILDSDHYVELLNSLFKENGRHAVLIYYREMKAPGLDSGRYNSKLKNETIFRAICSDGQDIQVTGKCVLAYRNDNKKNIEMRTLADDICITLLDIAEKETSLTAIKTFLNEITRPAVVTFKDYGVCKDVYKKGFFHGFDQSLTFLKSTDNTIENRLIFEVDNMLFKGFLLVPHQIIESSKIKKRVVDVEEAFKMWMRQMQYAIQQGNQIRRDPHDVGPLHELQYWRSMLAKYTSIVEFVASRPFCNYLTCLILSRSKIVKRWNILDNEITNELNEAKDNVRYMSSMERFWDPLYRCEPQEIGDNLPSLMMTVRLIYKTSRFYNTSDYITGFLEKITNQIVLACESYLTDRGCNSIWKQDKKSVIEKIEKCKELQVSFRFNYDRTQKEMENSPDETPWHCSDIYIFGKMETFSRRLNKIKEIMNISMTYEILDRIQISGMEKFALNIKTSINKIASKAYNPLAHRSVQFDKDFEIFQKEVEDSELGIQTFLKDVLQYIPTTEARINVLKRFDALNLDCLCMDRRYLDVAIVLEKEIENLKDTYNEGRSDPPIDHGVASTSGRIKWVRSLFKKMDDPISVLKRRPCVIENKHSQLAIKYYNYLSGVMLHYEMVHHKGWYDYAGQVRNNLEVPIIKKNSKTNWLELNLNPSVMETIKESESILKLDLEVPNVALVLTYCKNKIINSEEILKGLIKRNNSLRLSIPIVLLPLYKVQLLKIEGAFAPGLTTITWFSQNLNSFFNQVDKVLKGAENLLSELIDIKTARVDEILQTLEKSNLVFLPEGPVAPMKFVEANVNHRKIIEKQMQVQSRSVEMACIEIINRLVDEVQVSDRDENNKRKFQLPFDENATADIMRKEELLPIDKYDWINFEKLYKPVNFPIPKVHRKLCFKDYDGLKYDVTQLHNDCTELFAYFNHRIIAVLVKCTKTSLEKLKNRTNLTNLQISLKALDDAQNDPLFITDMELSIPACVISPSIGEIQRCFANVIHNVVETQYGITTWGKQAKTLERQKHKPLIGEIRHERTWFKTISEHKEIVRYIQIFAGGLMLIQPDIDGYLSKIYNEFMYLWSETRNEQIESFVKTSPMIADIREKFIEYDKIDEYIENGKKITVIGPIQIILDKAVSSILIESKAWKTTLGQKIELGSKDRLKIIIKYITDNEKLLSKKMNDLYDLRSSMKCLKNIRENFLEMDNAILLLENTYDLFTTFKINTSSKDLDLVDGLNYSFKKLLTQAKQVSNEIFSQKLKWGIDLINSISTFGTDVELFDEEVDENGSLTDNLSAKVAKDRILLMESKLEDMLALNEVHKDCSKLFGLEFKEHLLLKSLKSKIVKKISDI